LKVYHAFYFPFLYDFRKQKAINEGITDFPSDDTTLEEDYERYLLGKFTLRIWKKAYPKTSLQKIDCFLFLNAFKFYQWVKNLTKKY
jgi:hypothetical protein